LRIIKPTNVLKQKISLCLLPIFFATAMLGQTIKRIDGTNISVDSLQNKVNYLIKAANVSGVCVSIFNDNKPVFSKTFALANVPAKQPLTSASVMYAASFAKVVPY